MQIILAEMSGRFIEFLPFLILLSFLNIFSPRGKSLLESQSDMQAHGEGSTLTYLLSVPALREDETTFGR